MSNAILDWLEKRRVHRELLAQWDVLEKQAHAGMVFYELSEGHREAVTEKLKNGHRTTEGRFCYGQYRAAG